MTRTHRRVLATIATLAMAIGTTTIGATSAPALTNPAIPWLRLDHTITSQPWAGGTTKASDLEGSAFLPFDDQFVIADDQGKRVYFVDRSTGALVRTVAQSAFTAALPLGGGAPADLNRSDAFRGVAYDVFSDSIYVFSGNCCGLVGPFEPTVFRLKRDPTSQFQVESYQALPEGTDALAASVRRGTGLYFGRGTKIKTYDYATNTIGPDIKLVGTGNAILGMDFVDPSTLMVTNDAGQLIRVSTADWTAVSGWTFDLTGFGIGVAQSVMAIGDQFYVSDGDDTHPSNDPTRHRVYALNLGEAPPVSAAFTPHVTRGPAPLVVWFIDHSVRATAYSWNFGDGTGSTLANPAHIYTNAGTYNVTLHVTGVGGASDASAPITVLPAGTATGGYTLDGFGGVHPFRVDIASTPPATTGGGYWPGWDIARGLALTGDGQGGYMLDGFGGLHPIGVGSNPAPAATMDGPYWLGWDAARGVALMPNGNGGYVVDLFGGIHRFRIGTGPLPPAATGAPYWSGQDQARGIAVLPDGSGGYVVDRDGNLHAFSIGTSGAPPSPTGVWNAPPGQEAQGVAVLDPSRGGFTVDGFGVIHRFTIGGLAPPTSGNATWTGWNIARDLAVLPGS